MPQQSLDQLEKDVFAGSAAMKTGVSSVELALSGNKTQMAGLLLLLIAIIAFLSQASAFFPPLRQYLRFILSLLGMPYYLGSYGPAFAGFLIRGLRAHAGEKHLYFDTSDVGHNTTDTRYGYVTALGTSKYDFALVPGTSQVTFSLRENLAIHASWYREHKTDPFGVTNDSKSGETLGHYDVTFPLDGCQTDLYQSGEDPERTFGLSANFYWEEYLKKWIAQAHADSMPDYDGQSVVLETINNVLTFVMKQKSQELTDEVNAQIENSVQLLPWCFLWGDAFAIMESVKWDFSGQSLTFGVKDISWFGHFNNSETRGFGTVLGLSFKGTIGVTPNGVTYDLDCYILAYSKEIPIAHFTTDKAVNLASDSKTPEMKLFGGPVDSIFDVLEKISEGLEAAAPHLVSRIVDLMQEDRPLMLDHIEALEKK
ncbi:MAG: hypothetical protein HY913_04290 [Desulfomonile tiedjei]|nr:hypothetical protein [Desulfomonile tiedjei]